MCHLCCSLLFTQRSCAHWVTVGRSLRGRALNMSRVARPYARQNAGLLLEASHVRVLNGIRYPYGRSGDPAGEQPAAEVGSHAMINTPIKVSLSQSGCTWRGLSPLPACLGWSQPQQCIGLMWVAPGNGKACVKALDGDVATYHSICMGLQVKCWRRSLAGWMW